MTRFVVVLKPQLFCSRRVGEVLSYLEAQGFELFDCYALELTAENVYEFFETQQDYPSLAEVQSFLAGPSLVAALYHDEDELLDELENHYPCKVAKINQEQALSFWFGGGTMEEEPASE